MHTKETKDRRDKDGSTDYGCNPSDFQEMFRKMRMCCGGQGDLPHCKDMMEMMPTMMMSMMGAGQGEGGMMGMMSQMMGATREGEMPMMPEMMMEMMPRCLTMMLPNIPKEKRINFVLKMVTTLMEHGSVGMSEEEKKDFVEKVAEQVKT